MKKLFNMLLLAGVAIGPLALAERPPEEKIRSREQVQRQHEHQAQEGRPLEARRPLRGRPDMEPGQMPRMMHEATWLPRLLHQPRFAEQLGIDEDQAAAIRQRLTEHGLQMRELREELEAKAAQQADLMKADPIDEEAVLEVVAEIGAIRTRIDQLRVRELIFMRQILTDEQLERAAEIMPARVRMHRERSPAAGRAPLDSP